MSLQALLVMVGAAGLAGSSIALVRLRLLSLRYGLAWIAVSAVGVAGAPLLQLAADRVAELGLTPTGFSLGVLIGFLLLICLQLSVSLSGVHSAVQDLTEQSALNERRIRHLEAADPVRDGGRTIEDRHP